MPSWMAKRLEDIELRRNDEAFLDGLGAQRIPDPTTSGDFTHRFDATWTICSQRMSATDVMIH